MLVPSQENSEADFTVGPTEEEACIIKRHKPSPSANDEITSEELYVQASQSLSPEQMSRLTASIPMEDKPKIASIFQAFRFNSKFNHRFDSSNTSHSSNDNTTLFNNLHSNYSYFDSLSDLERQELKCFLENANFPENPSFLSPSIVHRDCHSDPFPIPVMKGQYYTRPSITQ